MPDWVKEVIESYDRSEWIKSLQVQLAVRHTNAQRYSISNDLIRFKGRLVVGDDRELKYMILQALHSSPMGGHLGVRAIYYRVRQLFFWLGLKKEVTDFVVACMTCQRCKHEQVAYQRCYSHWLYRSRPGKRFLWTLLRACPSLKARM